jgi:hypothetical protein
LSRGTTRLLRCDAHGDDTAKLIAALYAAGVVHCLHRLLVATRRARHVEPLAALLDDREEPNGRAIGTARFT